MPKNTVSDPITDQEVAFAHLIMSATMNDRRRSPFGIQPAAPPVEAHSNTPDWCRTQQHQPLGEEQGDPVATAKTTPAAQQVPKPGPSSEPDLKMANDTLSSNLGWNQLSVANPFINPEKLNRPSAATGSVFDTVLDKADSFRLPFFQEKGFSGRRR